MINTFIQKATEIVTCCCGRYCKTAAGLVSLQNVLMEYTAHQTGRGCVRSDSEREALPALEKQCFGPEVSLARLVARNGTSGNSD